jgi:hypothetical protein
MERNRILHQQANGETIVHDALIRMVTQLITLIAPQECGSIRRMDTNLAAPQFELEMQTLNSFF